MAYDIMKTALPSKKRLFHSYIVSGADETSRRDAAKQLAKIAVCSSDTDAACGMCRDCVKADKGIHPDITVIEREKDAREFTVDAMRGVRAAASMLPNEADRSVYIIAGGDNMNIPAQNAMLKILEEPPKHVVFIITAENPERLLPTVRSRCESLRLRPVESGINALEAERLVSSALVGDKMKTLEIITGLGTLSREDMLSFIGAVRREIIRKSASGEGETHFSKMTETLDLSEKYLNMNVSPGYITGLLMTGFV